MNNAIFIVLRKLTIILIAISFICFLSACENRDDTTWVSISHEFYLNLADDQIILYCNTAPTACQKFEKKEKTYVGNGSYYGDSIQIIEKGNNVILKAIGNKGTNGYFHERIDGLQFIRVHNLIEYDSVKLNYIRNNVILKNEVIEINQTIAHMIIDPQVTLTKSNEHGEVTYLLFHNGRIAGSKKGATIWPCR